MTVLVVGGSGYLGREVVRQALASGHGVAATHRGSPPGDSRASWHVLDLRERQRVLGLVRAVRPSAIVNAAYQQHDWSTTADGAAHLALAAVSIGAQLVHVSTDVVFSGFAVTYTETDLPDPISPYGAAKAAAETAIAAIDPGAAIVRTSLILGDDCPQERFVRRLARGEVDGALFTDDIRCPVHVTDLAAALLELVATGGDRAGIHHVAGPDAVSRYELGVLFARRAGLDPAVLPAGRRVDTDILGPLDVRLDCRATQARMTTRIRGVREFLG